MFVSLPLHFQDLGIVFHTKKHSFSVWILLKWVLKEQVVQMLTVSGLGCEVLN
jgi:hypothetical protein